MMSSAPIDYSPFNTFMKPHTDAVSLNALVVCLYLYRLQVDAGGDPVAVNPFRAGNDTGNSAAFMNDGLEDACAAGLIERLGINNDGFDVFTLPAAVADAARSKPEKRKRTPRKGYVYLLKSPTGLYKIGRAADPNNRLKTFNVKLPFEVAFECLIRTGDMVTLESELHHYFADKRQNGEWFALTHEDVEYLKSLAS